MRKWLRMIQAAVLAVMLTMGCVISLSGGQGKAVAEGDGNNGTGENTLPEELRVASPTAMEGNFFTDMFGNNSSDIDVRLLIHGYNLVNTDQNQGTYVLDPTVVTACAVAEDELGNRTYRLQLAGDLCYSDGTPITAWDYAFSLLLQIAPETEAIGGKTRGAEYLLGAEEYINYCRARMEGKQDDELRGGEFSKCLSGVKVQSDRELCVTLSHEFLPYFFEVGLLQCEPYPIHVLAPGCKVYDDGNGVYIGNADPAAEEPAFTPELLAKTILDERTGYNSHPSVTSGAYQLVSFDGETARFERNPHFKGVWVYSDSLYGGTDDNMVPARDENGRQQVDDGGNEIFLLVPKIEKITLTIADYDIRTDENGERYIGENSSIRGIADGEIHLVNKVANGTAIRDGHGMTGSVRSQSYPRYGLSFFAFISGRTAVSEKKVRQAIAWCIDREKLMEAYCGGYGAVVDGYYGLGQWEYMMTSGQLAYPIAMTEEENPETVEDERPLGISPFNVYEKVRSEEEYERAEVAWDQLQQSMSQLVHYGVYDLEKDPERTTKTGLDEANALLNEAGWYLNEEGGAFQAGTDEVRCKNVAGHLVSLRLKMLYPAGNRIADTMGENFIDHLRQAGIALEMVPTPMPELLDAFTGENSGDADMIFLGMNFSATADPLAECCPDDSGNRRARNNMYSDDEELCSLAAELRKTEPRSIYEYARKWIAFQKRFNEVLPCIPLYSNIYCDFYTDQLQNYDVRHTTWSQAILACYFAEPEIEEEEMGTEEEFFD